MKISVKPRTAIGPGLAAVVNLFLLTAIWADLRGGVVAPASKAEWNAGLSGSIGEVFSRKPIDEYKQILARPVFFKSRGPFVPPPPAPTVSRAAPAPTIVDPNLVLGGVMIQNDSKKAYLFSRANTAGAWISEGEEFLGWQIRSIDGSSASLEQKGRHIDLQLYPKE